MGRFKLKPSVVTFRVFFYIEQETVHSLADEPGSVSALAPSCLLSQGQKNMKPWANGSDGC